MAIESERLANRDHLTDTGNRRAFEAAFARLADEAGSRAGFVLMLFDLDGFKTVNDRHGHLVGDALLVHFVAALRAELPEPDLLVAPWRGRVCRHRPAARHGRCPQPRPAHGG